MPQLVQPSILYKESYIRALQEGFNSNTTAPPMTAEEINTINQDFEAYLNKGKNPEKMFHAPDGKDYERVAQTTLWLVKDDLFIGCANIRHELNDFLMMFGGHIGYAIRPSQRRQGYATLTLRLALDFLREKGLTRALLTTAEHNIGSQKAIERNNGILENVAEYSWLDYKLPRYWIDL